MVRVGLRPLVVLCALASLWACESPQDGATDGITGRERIGWDQRASDRAEIATFQYALYVDGARSVLAGAACDEAPGPEGFGCSAPLPGLSPGSRVLELAAFVVQNGAVLESAKSPPLRVTVASRVVAGSSGAAVGGAIQGVGTTEGRGDAGVGPAASPPPDEGATSPRAGTSRPTSDVPAASAAPIVTTDGVRLESDVVAHGLTAPADFAQAPDGRFFVAERGGRVMLFDLEEGRAGVALDLRTPGDAQAAASSGPELLALALHPAFDRTGLVFLVSSVPEGHGARTFEVARYREAGGRLGERAVLLDGVPAIEGAAVSVRFGPDGRLFLSLDDRGEPGAAGSLGSYGGKVLRMTAEGTLPADNPLSSLVYSWGAPAPRAFDWHPGDGALWVLGRSPGGRDELARVRPGGTAAPKWTLSGDLQPGATGAAFYGEGSIEPFRGNLFVAAADGAHLLRLVFDPSDPSRIVARERLFANTFGRIERLIVARDGALYFSTNNVSALGAGRDVIVRVRPGR
jgi:glucose/arabinose dehydrogenase